MTVDTATKIMFPTRPPPADTNTPLTLPLVVEPRKVASLWCKFNYSHRLPALTGLSALILAGKS